MGDWENIEEVLSRRYVYMASDSSQEKESLIAHIPLEL